MQVTSSSKCYVSAGWDDVPHLSDDAKRELLASTPRHLRDARSKGIPSMGAGAVYPVDIDTLLVEPFPIPAYWRRAYGLDVGWNRTAALWLAYDPDPDTVYFYTEHYQGQALPAVHAAAIKARGAWIPGVIDPAARGRSQRDGEQLIVDYRKAGLNLVVADNSVEAGIYEVWTRMETGRLKIFRTLGRTQHELRLYRRDDRGKIVKKHDHLMDAMRYAIMSGLRIATTKPVPKASPLSRAGDDVIGY